MLARDGGFNDQRAVLHAFTPRLQRVHVGANRERKSEAIETE